MQRYVETLSVFRGGPWDGAVKPVRFEKSKPRVAVVVIDEPIEGIPADITAPGSFTRHVYALAPAFHDRIDSMTVADEVEFHYEGPMAAGAGRLN